METLRDGIERHRKLLRICMVERHRSDSFLNVNHHLYHIQQRTEEMAKTIKQSNKKEVKKVEFKGFVNYDLNSEQKDAMRVWIRDLEATQVELDEMLAGQYQVKVFKNTGLGAYQATAFCANPEDVNAGLILQAFAPHWFDALCCLAYKHAIVLEAVWPQAGDIEKDTWG